jgi:hypothetical protein
MRNDEAKKTAEDRFSGLVADFCVVDIQKLVTRNEKCPNLGDYVEK